MLTDATKGAKGGNLLSILNRFTQHGHPFVKVTDPFPSSLSLSIAF